MLWSCPLRVEGVRGEALGEQVGLDGAGGRGTITGEEITHPTHTPTLPTKPPFKILKIGIPAAQQLEEPRVGLL